MSALRFLLACVLGTVTATAFATFTLPVFVALIDPGKMPRDVASLIDFGATVIAMVVFIPYGIIFGSVVAFPASLIIGGVMVWLVDRKPNLNRNFVWGFAGALAAQPAASYLSHPEPFFANLLAMPLWLGASGAIGALVFRWVWRYKRAAV
jgi:hypothetical protein